jgi:hypothetical protein
MTDLTNKITVHKDLLTEQLAAKVDRAIRVIREVFDVTPRSLVKKKALESSAEKYVLPATI